jgi:hypothetical protein
LRTDGWLVVAANLPTPTRTPWRKRWRVYAPSRWVDVEHRATKFEPGLDAAGDVDVQEIAMPPEARVIITGRTSRIE